MRTTAIVFVLALASPSILAQGPDSGAASPPAHADACAACHGANGISVAPGTPHLAAQDEDYLRAQIMAYRAGARQNPLMNAIAGNLSDDEVDALAGFYAGLAGAPRGAARSELLPELIKADFPFPQDYQASLTRYHTIDRGVQVRHYYANDAALGAAREGRPLPDGSYLLVEIMSAVLGDDGQPVVDGDGRFLAGEPIGFNAMAREAGWGDAVPELLRNENWLYANFAADGTVNTSVNQAACLACHVPLTEDSYTFTIGELAETARR